MYHVQQSAVSSAAHMALAFRVTVHVCAALTRHGTDDDDDDDHAGRCGGGARRMSITTTKTANSAAAAA